MVAVCYTGRTMNDQYRTPGQLIKAQLRERGWTQQLLAVILDMDGNAISQIVVGKRSVTADLAIVLGEVFDVPAERFLQLQRDYDLDKAKIEAMPDPGRVMRARLLGQLPIVEMMRRGWLGAGDIRNVPEVEKALVAFFGVESVDQIEILPYAARKTDTFTPATPAQLAWVYRVKQVAADLLVAKYSAESTANAVSLLEKMRSVREDVRKVPQVLAEHGIRYVIVETLPAAKIDGVCLWLDSESPVVGMSLRFDRLDNYWFVLRHELEHVLRLHGRDSAKVMLDADMEELAGSEATIAEEERQANDAAANFCVPREMMDKYIACQSPYFDLRDFLGFANVLNVHPALVAGQLQRRTERYELFRKYLVKIHDLVVPNARTDGWGTVAPSAS